MTTEEQNRELSNLEKERELALDKNIELCGNLFASWVFEFHNTKNINIKSDIKVVDDSILQIIFTIEDKKESEIVS